MFNWYFLFFKYVLMIDKYGRVKGLSQGCLIVEKATFSSLKLKNYLKDKVTQEQAFQFMTKSVQWILFSVEYMMYAYIQLIIKGDILLEKK